MTDKKLKSAKRARRKRKAREWWVVEWTSPKGDSWWSNKIELEADARRIAELGFMDSCKGEAIKVREVLRK